LIKEGLKLILKNCIMKKSLTAFQREHVLYIALNLYINPYLVIIYLPSKMWFYSRWTQKLFWRLLDLFRWPLT